MQRGVSTRLIRDEQRSDSVIFSEKGKNRFKWMLESCWEGEVFLWCASDSNEFVRQARRDHKIWSNLIG